MTERDRRGRDDKPPGGDDILEPLLIITPDVIEGSVADEEGTEADAEQDEDGELMEEWL